MNRRPTRILCLGNELLADDGAGPAVAAALQGRIPEECDLVVSQVGGLRLLDEVTGVDRLLVVDAALSGSAPPGTIRILRPGSLAVMPPCTQHAFGLAEALQLAARLGLEIPQETTVITIEAADVTTVGGAMTPEVAAAVEEAAEMCVRLAAGAGLSELES